ncbi:MAG: ATP-binding protein [Oscillospiraceae bacterium]|nr:ATP-binding protein [Oscillospiraceae bacterium]
MKNPRHYEFAEAQLSARRKKNAALTESRREEVRRSIPEANRLLDNIADTGTKIVRLIGSKGDIRAEVAKIEKTNNELRKQLKDLLRSNGKPTDYLEPIYDCGVCRDSGVANGQRCGCFNLLVRQCATNELNERSPLKLATFDTFSSEEFKGDDRRYIEGLKSECELFADEFNPDPNRQTNTGLLFTGPPGTGKTHLALAIANRVVERGRGYGVVYGSVPDLLIQAEHEHFRKWDDSQVDTLQLLRECSLLILDDLGVETRTPFYSMTLYGIMNARICRGLSTIVSTNLKLEELQVRYDQRLNSRLGALKLIRTRGRDMRLKKTTAKPPYNDHLNDVWN